MMKYSRYTAKNCTLSACHIFEQRAEERGWPRSEASWKNEDLKGPVKWKSARTCNLATLPQELKCADSDPTEMSSSSGELSVPDSSSVAVWLGWSKPWRSGSSSSIFFLSALGRLLDALSFAATRGVPLKDWA